MRKRIIATAGVLLSLSGNAADIVSYENLYIDVDFLRDISCSVDDAIVDFGNIIQGEEHEDTVYITGTCSEGVNLVIYPTDKKPDFNGRLKNTEATYQLSLETVGDSYRDNGNDSYCGSGQDFSNIDGKGCHVYHRTKSGAFNIPLKVKLKTGGRALKEVVDFRQIIPLTAKVTYDK